MNSERLAAMRDTMQHRGPDDAGLWISDDGRVGLAHRRLAIIDLSPGGHQPMADNSGQFHITFNGEIYNYLELRRDLESRGSRFRTSSDTEVILEAYREWGTDCLSRLNGMFAFALYDVPARKLFLARDRAGEKPLFYTHANGRFLFASELKAIMADPSFSRRLNLTALQHYLAYGYIMNDHCILEGVHKLPQGAALTYDLSIDQVRTWTYWQLPEASSPSDRSDEELVDELEYLLQDSVRGRMIADVPVGIMLSGGIDSSLITALAARTSSKPVKTFTVIFPQDKAFNEGPDARRVAERFGTEHTELQVGYGSVDLLPRLAAQFDEPMADSSMVPTYLVSQMIRQHATVALGGDGGDELFGGYWHHRLLQQHERLQSMIPAPVRGLLARSADRLLPVGTRGRHYLTALAVPPRESIASVNLFFNSRDRDAILAPSARRNGAASPEHYKNALRGDAGTLLQRMTAIDFCSYMVDDILVKVDRASMLTSLELRAPYLDHRVIEFAFGRLPDRLRATGNEMKILPRLLARRLLPAETLRKRKQGFSIPFKRWFTKDWGQFIRSVLNEADPAIFNQRAIEQLLVGQESGYANTHRLFALTMFELWRRQYNVLAPVGTPARQQGVSSDRLTS